MGMRCTWLCVCGGNSILLSGRAGGEDWTRRRGTGLTYRSSSDTSVWLTIYRGKLHLRQGIALIRAWRYETEFVLHRRQSDRQKLKPGRREFSRNESVKVCLTRECTNNRHQVARATKCCTVVAATCGCSIWNLVHIAGTDFF
jgi:hypothetical protein